MNKSSVSVHKKVKTKLKTLFIQFSFFLLDVKFKIKTKLCPCFPLKSMKASILNNFQDNDFQRPKGKYRRGSIPLSRYIGCRYPCFLVRHELHFFRNKILKFYEDTFHDNSLINLYLREYHVCHFSWSETITQTRNATTRRGPSCK